MCENTGCCSYTAIVLHIRSAVFPDEYVPRTPKKDWNLGQLVMVLEHTLTHAVHGYADTREEEGATISLFLSCVHAVVCRVKIGSRAPQKTFSDN